MSALCQKRTLARLKSCSDLRSSFDPRVDLAAERPEINGLREKRLSAALQRSALLSPHPRRQ